MPRLKTFEVPTEVKLSAAWAATVLCYIYCDYFDLYLPGKLQRILDGHGPFGPHVAPSLVESVSFPNFETDILLV